MKIRIAMTLMFATELKKKLATYLDTGGMLDWILFNNSKLIKFD
jgi:hypothetical protein